MYLEKIWHLEGLLNFNHLNGPTLIVFIARTVISKQPKVVRAQHYNDFCIIVTSTLHDLYIAVTSTLQLFSLYNDLYITMTSALLSPLHYSDFCITVTSIIQWLLYYSYLYIIVTYSLPWIKFFPDILYIILDKKR